MRIMLICATQGRPVMSSLNNCNHDSPSCVPRGSWWGTRWVLTAVETELQSNRDELLWGMGIGLGST